MELHEIEKLYDICDNISYDEVHKEDSIRK